MKRVLLRSWPLCVAAPLRRCSAESAGSPAGGRSGVPRGAVPGGTRRLPAPAARRRRERAPALQPREHRVPTEPDRAGDPLLRAGPAACCPGTRTSRTTSLAPASRCATPPEPAGLATVAFFWLGSLTLAEVFWFFAAANVLFWCLLAIRISPRAEWTHYLLFLLLTTWLLAGASFWLKWHQAATDDRGGHPADRGERSRRAGHPRHASCSSSTRARSSTSSGSEEGWSLIRLPDGKRGWLRAEAARYTVPGTSSTSPFRGGSKSSRKRGGFGPRGRCSGAAGSGPRGGGGASTVSRHFGEFHRDGGLALHPHHDARDPLRKEPGGFRNRGQCRRSGPRRSAYLRARRVRAP